MSADLIPLFFAWFVAFIFSTTLHEAGHAYAAHRLGDSTAYLGGQVSLNPVPHVRREPFGMVLVPILSFFLMGGNWMIGWASAPYNPQWALRYPRKSALMAAAGPAANLLLMVTAGLALRGLITIGYLQLPTSIRFTELASASSTTGSGSVATLLSIVFTLNLVLLIFNLLPLPPLDGSAVIQLVMPASMARYYQGIIRNPMWAWVGIIAAWRFFPTFFGPLYNVMLRILYAGV